MESQIFRNRIEWCNLRVLAELLKMPCIRGSGIDLYDSKIAVELKSRYARWTHTWTVHAKQIWRFPKENPGNRLYWAFMLYDLKVPPRKIRRSIYDDDLEALVTMRTVRLIPWNQSEHWEVWWPKTGPYCYPKEKELPHGNNYVQYQINGTTLYVPRQSISLQERITDPNWQQDPF